MTILTVSMYYNIMRYGNFSNVLILLGKLVSPRISVFLCVVVFSSSSFGGDSLGSEFQGNASQKQGVVQDGDSKFVTDLVQDIVFVSGEFVAFSDSEGVHLVNHDLSDLEQGDDFDKDRADLATALAVSDRKNTLLSRSQSTACVCPECGQAPHPPGPVPIEGGDIYCPPYRAPEGGSSQ